MSTVDSIPRTRTTQVSATDPIILACGQNSPSQAQLLKTLTAAFAFLADSKGQWIPTPLQRMIADFAVRLWTDFEDGDNIDVEDKMGKRYCATVVATEVTSIKIHYMGWSPTWDEWINRYVPDSRQCAL